MFGRMVKQRSATAGRSGPRCSCSSSAASPRRTGPRRAAIRSMRRAASTSRRRATNPGGNMEGKEVRFGIANSALYATVTTDASCGAVNAMHDSFTPLGGLVPLVNIQLGEVVFGGVGAGLYGMLVMVVLTVFIAGLMVGRTPEYLGKKIQSARGPDGDALRARLRRRRSSRFTAVSSRARPPGLKGLNNAGPARLLRDPLRLHARRRRTTAAPSPASRARPTTTTRCSASNTLIGRFAMMVPMLALAGFLAEKKIAPEIGGNVPGHGAAVRRPARRRDPDRRRAHLLPGARARSDRRAPARWSAGRLF